MNLAFLDSDVTCDWVLHHLSKRVQRQLLKDVRDTVDVVAETVDKYSEQGLHPACTIASASEVVTRMFKSSSPPFKGDCKGFQVRKSLAREASGILRSKAVLLAPTDVHFAKAEQLWLVWCDDQAKESYARFSDYVDAALILDPPANHRIPTSLLGHYHVLYILRKERSKTIPHILPVSRFR